MTVGVLGLVALVVAAVLLFGPGSRTGRDFDGDINAVAAGPDGSRVYALHQADGLSVLDPESWSVESEIHPNGLGTLPEANALAVDPSGTHAYIGHGTQGGAGGVIAIDMATPNAREDIEAGGVDDLVVSPDGRSIYTIGSNADRTGRLSQIDVATGTVTGTVTTPAELYSIALSPDGGRVYVGGWDGVTVVDTADRTVVATIAPTAGSSSDRVMSLAVSPDGRSVYASLIYSPSIMVIDTGRNAVVAGVSPSTAGQGDPAVHAVTVAPDGRRLYVAYDHDDGSAITAIDTSTRAVVATVSTEWISGDELVMAPDGRRLYVNQAFRVFEIDV